MSSTHSLSASCVIRKARLKDAHAIFELIQNATQSGKILKRSITDIRRVIRHFWVAEEDGGALMACCALEVYNRKLAEVRSLAVAPQHREKGIASAMIEVCLKEARKRRIYEVLAITDRESLFKRNGFFEQLHGQKALFLRP